MTKRNLTLGTASGRLGSVVYFRRRGQQIARVLVSSVNDKRSLAQCRQRARFANYVASWRMLRRYVEDSWRGVSRHGSTENAFYKHNRLLMPAISKEMSRLGYGWPPLGIVTYGSLNVGLQIVSGKATRQGSDVENYWVWLPYGSAAEIPSTISDFSRVITSAGYGVQYGDIVHLACWNVPIRADVYNLPAAWAEVEPTIYHSSFVVSNSDESFAEAVPWWRMELLYPPNGGSALLMRLALGWQPADPTDGETFPFYAVWVERPSNPSYSRFSRARFMAIQPIMEELLRFTKNTEFSDLMASTYQGV